MLEPHGRARRPAPPRTRRRPPRAEIRPRWRDRPILMPRRPPGWRAKATPDSMPRLDWIVIRYAPAPVATGVQGRLFYATSTTAPSGGGARQESCAQPRKTGTTSCAGAAAHGIGLLRGSRLKPFPVNREPNGAGGRHPTMMSCTRRAGPVRPGRRPGSAGRGNTALAGSAAPPPPARSPPSVESSGPAPPLDPPRVALIGRHPFRTRTVADSRAPVAAPTGDEEARSAGIPVGTLSSTTGCHGRRPGARTACS